MGLLEIGKEAPGKYSMVLATDYEKLLCAQFRKTLNLPKHVHDDMIARQLRYCKGLNMSATETKRYLDAIYQDDIHDRLSEEEKAVIAKAMEGYRK